MLLTPPFLLFFAGFTRFLLKFFKFIGAATDIYKAFMMSSDKFVLFGGNVFIRAVRVMHEDKRVQLRD